MNANLINEIQLQLLESMHDWYPEISDANASLIYLGEKEFRWSKHFLFRIVDQGGVIDVLAKHERQTDTNGRVQTESRPSANALMLEFQALSVMYEHLKTGEVEGVTAVRPLKYFSDIDVLVTEYLPGTNMLSLLSDVLKPWKWRTGFQRTFDAAYQGGVLLGTVHKMKSTVYPRKVSFDWEQYCHKLQQKVASLADLISQDKVRGRLRMVQHAVQERSLGINEDTTITYLHGDYYPENLVQLADGSVYTVDTTLHQVGPVEDDIAKFLVGIETLKWRMLGSPFLTHTVTINKVREYFIAGYCTQAQFSDRILLLSELVAVMQRWSEVLQVLDRTLPSVIASSIQRTRINPFMLSYLQSLWAVFQGEPLAL